MVRAFRQAGERDAPDPHRGRGRPRLGDDLGDVPGRGGRLDRDGGAVVVLRDCPDLGGEVQDPGNVDLVTVSVSDVKSSYREPDDNLRERTIHAGAVRSQPGR